MAGNVVVKPPPQSKAKPAKKTPTKKAPAPKKTAPKKPVAKSHDNPLEHYVKSVKRSLSQVGKYQAPKHIPTGNDDTPTVSRTPLTTDQMRARMREMSGGAGNRPAPIAAPNLKGSRGGSQSSSRSSGGGKSGKSKGSGKDHKGRNVKHPSRLNKALNNFSVGPEILAPGVGVPLEIAKQVGKLAGADKVVDTVEAPAKLAGTLINPVFWQRVGWIVLGVFVFLLSLYLIFRKPINSAVMTAVVPEATLAKGLAK